MLITAYQIYRITVKFLKEDHRKLLIMEKGCTKKGSREKKNWTDISGMQRMNKSDFHQSNFHSNPRLMRHLNTL